MNLQPVCGPESSGDVTSSALSILVIEDETAMYMEDILNGFGCRVATAARVPSALEIIAAQRIDGAFLDVSVCGAPIAPVVKELRARGIPFAFVTGYAPDHLPADYRAYHILSKPVIEARIAEALAGFSAYQPAAELTG
jgi:CheY-like chemotaxis protein